MAKRRAKPPLPPLPPLLVVTIREVPPTPGQAAAWKRFWDLVFAPLNEKPAGETAGGDGETSTSGEAS